MSEKKQSNPRVMLGMTIPEYQFRLGYGKAVELCIRPKNKPWESHHLSRETAGRLLIELRETLRIAAPW